MPNTMTPEEFQAHFNRKNRDQAAAGGKIKTNLMHPKKEMPSTMNAQQYRDNYVDQEESPLQKRCVTWFKAIYPALILFAIPNGGYRTAVEAVTLLDEGVLPGMPDLCLACPAGEYHGLYIEMKTMRKGSKLSDEQIIVHARLRAAGYDVAIPQTFEAFQIAIFNYLNARH